MKKGRDALNLPLSVLCHCPEAGAVTVLYFRSARGNIKAEQRQERHCQWVNVVLRQDGRVQACKRARVLKGNIQGPVCVCERACVRAFVCVRARACACTCSPIRASIKAPRGVGTWASRTGVSVELVPCVPLLSRWNPVPLSRWYPVPLSSWCPVNPVVQMSTLLQHG